MAALRPAARRRTMSSTRNSPKSTTTRRTRNRPEPTLEGGAWLTNKKQNTPPGAPRGGGSGIWGRRPHGEGAVLRSSRRDAHCDRRRDEGVVPQARDEVASGPQ